MLYAEGTYALHSHSTRALWHLQSSLSNVLDRHHVAYACRWSIEGAIGSKHKVDASYLSPNVNMAARLETATKQYGVAILMSADFAALLSPRMRARCRQIDTVLVKGSSQPMGIWTIDTDTRFIKSDGLRAFQDNLKFVHDSLTPLVHDKLSGNDEFDMHPDVQNSYAVDAEFLNTWKVRSIICSMFINEPCCCHMGTHSNQWPLLHATLLHADACWLLCN